eukprot:scaffold15742_cov71-Phaeocystis_antarctica.AAC.13
MECLISVSRSTSHESSCRPHLPSRCRVWVARTPEARPREGPARGGVNWRWQRPPRPIHMPTQLAVRYTL